MVLVTSYLGVLREVIHAGMQLSGLRFNLQGFSRIESHEVDDLKEVSYGSPADTESYPDNDGEQVGTEEDELHFEPRQVLVVDTRHLSVLVVQCDWNREGRSVEY